jgi:hypothetical protein
MTNYIFQRGETVAVALQVVAGDAATVSAVTAAMKPVAAGRASVDPAAAVAATFEVTFDASGPRWLLSLSPVVSAALAAGRYVADARLVVGGGVAITETVALTLRDAVTS